MRQTFTATEDKVCILGNNFAKDLQKHAGLDVAVLPEFLGGTGSSAGIGEVLPVPADAWSSVSR